LRTRAVQNLVAAALLLGCLSALAAAQEDSGTTPSTLVIKAGTKVMLDLDTPMNTTTARIDDIVWFTSRDDIKVGGRMALPRGTPVRGSVVVVKPAVVNGKNQRTELQVRLEEIPLEGGGSYAISANRLKVQGEKPSSGTTAQGAIGQAAQGAILGGSITQSAKGAGIGAAAAVLVTVISNKVKSGGPTSDVDLPRGSVFETKLDRNLNIPDPAMLAKAVPAPASPKTPDTPAVAVADSATVASASTEPVAGQPEAPARGVPTFETASVSSAPPVAVSDPEKDKGDSRPDTASVATIRPSVLSVDVNLVQVDAVVRDRAGKPLGNLRREDFQVYEDGVEKHIQFFSRDQLPLAVALVIDRSGSVAPLMSEVQEAAYQALKLLKTGDQVCLFSFDSNVALLEELTTDRQRVANHIGRITAGGGTAIVDGISEALRYLETTAPDHRRAIILISDNIEGRSRASARQAVEYALETEAVVYSVKVGNAISGGILGLPVPGLPRLPLPGSGNEDAVKRITKETGGEIFDATGGASISAALTTAVDRLKLRYTLSYAGSSLKPGARSAYHRIEVRLVSRFGRPDVDYTVHARSGYYDSSQKTK